MRSLQVPSSRRAASKTRRLVAAHHAGALDTELAAIGGYRDVTSVSKFRYRLNLPANHECPRCGTRHQGGVKRLCVECAAIRAVEERYENRLYREVQTLGASIRDGVAGGYLDSGAVKAGLVEEFGVAFYERRLAWIFDTESMKGA